MTTRQQVTEPVAQIIALDVLSEEEGALLVLKRAKRLALDDSLESGVAEEIIIARSLTQRLGGLPLALDQAGAYIAETRCSLSEYLELFKRERAALLQRRGTVPSDHPQSVTATFALAIERVRQKNEAAIHLLTVLAFLAPDTIPLEIITQGAVHLGTDLEILADDVLQLDLMLEILQAYSLVQRDGENRTLSIHRLVQVVLLDMLSETDRRLWTERVVRAVNVIFPFSEFLTWPQCERLLSQALAVTQSIKEDQTISEEAGWLLYKSANYLQERARYDEAEPLYRRALRIWEQHLGPEHLTMASALNSLAILYMEQGKYAQAEPLYQRALHILEHHLGPEHPKVASTLNNLAVLLYDQGRYVEAALLHERALRIREQHLGLEHPDLASTLNNLANLYREQGRYAEAEPLYQRALHIWEQHLGPEHPQVAYPLDGLANLYYEQGRYSEAEPLYQRALRLREKARGTQHIETAETMYGLAQLREAQGDTREACTLYARAMAVREQVLGMHHPHTVEIRKRLIVLLHMMEQDESDPSLRSE